jgi:hypothetical protein
MSTALHTEELQRLMGDRFPMRVGVKRGSPVIPFRIRRKIFRAPGADGQRRGREAGGPPRSAFRNVAECVTAIRMLNDGYSGDCRVASVLPMPHVPDGLSIAPPTTENSTAASLLPAPVGQWGEDRGNTTGSGHSSGNPAMRRPSRRNSASARFLKLTSRCLFQAIVYCGDSSSKCRSAERASSKRPR